MDFSSTLFAGEVQAAHTPQQVAAQVCDNLLDTWAHEAGLTERDVDHMPNYLRTGQRLGSGSFGSVELMYLYDADTTAPSQPLRWRRIAVKSISLYRYQSTGAALQLAAQTEREVQLSRRASPSAHVLAVEEAWIDRRTWSIQLQMDAGDESLETYVVRRHRFRMPADFLPSICAQTAEALRDLHAAGVVHRDVKPANFIVNVAADDARPPLVRLTDFGLSCALEDTARLAAANVGTGRFMAPETFVVGGGADLPTARDVWSLGVTLFVLATGFFPAFRFAWGNAWLIRPPCDAFGEPITDGVAAILRVVAGMLRYRYAERYSIDEVLCRFRDVAQHPGGGA